MTKYFRLLALVVLAIYSGCAQPNMKIYEGNWEGILANKNTFSLTISLEQLKAQEYNLKISGSEASIIKRVLSSSKEHIEIKIDENAHFNGVYSKDKNEINGFLTSGMLKYHLTLKKNHENKYIGIWNPLMIDSLQSQSIFLSVEEANGESFVAYPFFGDQRFSGTWCRDFIKHKDTILFRDFKTGLQFRGKLYSEKIELEILFANKRIAKTNLSRSKTDWNFGPPNIKMNTDYNEPIALNDGWSISNLQDSKIEYAPLVHMLDSIQAKSLVNTHSVLIAKEGKLVFEKYFDGYNYTISHDQRSASKSISSAITGIAIDHKIITSVDQNIFEFIDKQFQNGKDDPKSKIRIRDLLTMSSGIDAIDFGIKRNSAASENEYQQSGDWLKTVLNAPMIGDPGTKANYGSANPYLLGVCLNEELTNPLELFMDQELFQPLGITNYIIQTDIIGQPYFGGGMYLTPRDMLKFGQLYLNKGQWNGRRIISEKWVQDSFNNYLHLENTTDKNGYGYLWWHKTYDIGGVKIKSIEARGAGGQYIVVIPQLNSVVVITSGNYRNGKYMQPEEILEKYVVPSILVN